MYKIVFLFISLVCFVSIFLACLGADFDFAGMIYDMANEQVDITPIESVLTDFETYNWEITADWGSVLNPLRDFINGLFSAIKSVVYLCYLLVSVIEQVFHWIQIIINNTTLLSVGGFPWGAR